MSERPSITPPPTAEEVAAIAAALAVIEAEAAAVDGAEERPSPWRHAARREVLRGDLQDHGDILV